MFDMNCDYFTRWLDCNRDERMAFHQFQISYELLNECFARMLGCNQHKQMASHRCERDERFLLDRVSLHPAENEPIASS